jgi:hypothetical protein
MVVVLILATLVSLISSAVVKGMDKITENQTRSEIAEMEVALRAFMSDYGLTEPPPSYLLLYENISLYATDSAATQSYQFLQKLFGKDLGKVGGFVDWNGNGQPDGPYPPLQGNQCLVFYLGGIPNSAAVRNDGASPAPQGFAANNINPGLSQAKFAKRKGPYFSFASTRLWPQLQQVPPGWNGFFYYLDPWMTKTGPLYLNYQGSPYAFFSSTGINNKYAITTDCGAYPYMTGVGQFTNSNTYQIISAGKDGYFGTAVNNLWSPSAGATGTGADDQANFSSSLLGAGQN